MPSKQNKGQQKTGFTIIEVVLVLAIAGLIFLMVFVALPALQRSQRDTARRNDMSRVDTSLVQYQTNHNTDTNNLPTGPSFWQGAANFTTTTTQGGQSIATTACTGNAAAACEFVRDYMNTGSSEKDKDNEFTDPDGTPYSLAITGNWDLTTPITTSYNVTRQNQTYTSTLQVTGSGPSGALRGTITGDNAYDAHVVWIVPGGRCDSDKVAPSQQRHFAVLYRLEGAGVYCIDDQ